jgi:hypothetical protein
MSTSELPPTEAELRAAYEAEIKRIRVEHLLIEDVVSLINLGMRRTGMAPGTEEERDPDQVRVAIEAIRAVLPLIEQVAPDQAGPIRDALSQLQLAYVRIGGSPGGDAIEREAAPGQGAAPMPGASPPTPPPEPVKPGEPGPAQRSGRLWVPGQ